MDVGADIMGVIKTHTKGFCKDIIQNITKDWLGGYYLVLSIKPMVPRFRTPISIGYKYNVRKFLPFIVTQDSGSTNSGLPYLYKYPEQFYHVSIFPVAHTLVVYKFFGSVNEVDSQNKSMQSDLAMEKFWVTHYGWLWLCTTVSMVITITNFWKTSRYGVKRYYYEKSIRIR